MKLTGDEPAMPHYKKQLTENVFEQLTDGGLTIRQYFAAIAMQGLLSNPAIVTGNKGTISIPALSQSATDYADALIVELNKEK